MVFTCFYWWFGAFGGLDSDWAIPLWIRDWILRVPRFESQTSGFHPVEVISALKLNFNTNRLKAGRSMGHLVFSQQPGGFWWRLVPFCLKVGFQCDVKFMCHRFLCRISEFNINLWKILCCKYYLLGFCRVTHSGGVFLFCLYILDVFISWFWFVSYTYTWQKPLF